MDFRCGLSANSTEFCFAANSSCLDLGPDYGQVCTNCPPGFAHDFSFGHFPTCSLPENFYKVLFAVLTPPYFISMILFFKLSFTLKADIRRLCNLLIFTGFVHWAWLLCLYLQNGFFEGAIFFHCTIVDQALIQTALYELFFLTPVYAALRISTIDKLKRWMLVRLVPNFILVTCFGIILIVHARSKPSVFNFYFVIYLGLDLGFSSINTLIVIREGRRLQKLLKATARNTMSESNSTQLLFLLGRLLQHEQMIKTMMTPVLLNNLYMIISLCVIGSIPYNFAVVTVHLCSVTLSSFPAYNFLNPKSKQNSKQRSGNGTNSNATAVKVQESAD